MIGRLLLALAIILGVTADGRAAYNTYNGQPYLFVTLASSQTGMITATPTKVVLGNVIFDTAGGWIGTSSTACSSSTGFCYKPNVAGKYQITVAVYCVGGGTGGGIFEAFIYKNGSEVGGAQYTTANTNTLVNAMIHTEIITFNGSTDYVEAWGETTGTSGLAFFGGSAAFTYMIATYVGP